MNGERMTNVEGTNRKRMTNGEGTNSERTTNDGNEKPTKHEGTMGGHQAQETRVSWGSFLLFSVPGDMHALDCLFFSFLCAHW